MVTFGRSARVSRRSSWSAMIGGLPVRRRNAASSIKNHTIARVCTYSGAGCPCTCTCAYPTPSYPQRPQGTVGTRGRRQPATRRTANSAAKRNARRFQPAPIVARRRRNSRHSRANRPRQMERMGIARIQDRKAPAMERARRIRVDRTPVRITYSGSVPGLITPGYQLRNGPEAEVASQPQVCCIAVSIGKPFFTESSMDQITAH